MLLGHVHNNDEIAQLINILLEHCLQLQMGISGGKAISVSHCSFLEIHRNQNLLTSVWVFIDHLKAKIHIENAWEVKPQRIHA